MKVVFTYYPASVNYNHGISVLSKVCKNAGIETYIIPLGSQFEKKINEIQPNWVCFSFVTVHDYQLSSPYISACKFPKIAGGVFARKGGKIDGFDYICRGEAERIDDFFLNNDMAIFEDQILTKNINLFPDYSHVTGYEMDRGYKDLIGKKIIPYSSSRGCPFDCSFCENKNLPQVIRIKTSITEDIKYIENKFNPELLYFLDELLPYYSKEWRDQFKNNTIPFIAYIRADINEEDLLFLISNGLYMCMIGIESGDEKFRNDVLNKNLKNEDIFRTIAILRAYGIKYVTFYMLYYPGETEEIRTETYAMRNAIGGYNTTWKYEDLSLWDG